MKILVVSTPIFRLCPPQGTVGYSGLESLAWSTAVGLAAKGHQVTIAAPDDSVVPDATLLSVGVERVVDERMAFDRYKHLLSEVDVVIDHSWAKFSYLEKARGLRTPVLGVLHAPVNTMYQSLPPNVPRPCFVCISEDQRAHFEALHGREARTCYNGIDLAFYRPIENLQRSNRFLFVARFSSIKSPLMMIQVCKAAGVGLDLIGDTTITAEPEYFAQCRQECDGVQIRMVGPATRGEVVWWMSQAHAFVHATPNFREPFGLAVVEAMACGLPVLAWKYGAVKETVLHGKTGWLAMSFDECVDVVKTWAQQSNMIDDAKREDCRSRASQFSMQQMIDRYEVLSLEAVQTGGW